MEPAEVALRPGVSTGDGRTGVPRIWLATTAVAPVSPCTPGRRVGYGVVAERAGLNCINYVLGEQSDSDKRTDTDTDIPDTGPRQIRSDKIWA